MITKSESETTESSLAQYSAPTYITFGSIEELTLGPGGTAADGLGGTKPPDVIS